MDKDRSIIVLLFEVDFQAVTVLGVREDLGSKEGHDVIGDRVHALELEIRVVDA